MEEVEVKPSRQQQYRGRGERGRGERGNRGRGERGGRGRGERSTQNQQPEQ